MKTKTRRNNKTTSTEKSKPMIVLTEAQRNLLNEIRHDFDLKNQNEALQVLIDVANANRTKGSKDQFSVTADRIKHERNRVANAARIAKLQALLEEAKKLEAVS